jgi:thioredoxin-like negative regulator of GroEL
VDKLADEYGDRVAFVAAAWKGTPEATAERAHQIFESGKVAWGLDADEHIFAAFGIPYQPATVLIGRNGQIVESWLGARSEAAMRASIESLLSAA